MENCAEKELDDMTECSICNEVFIDPRGLPCLHTFCLKCLLDYGKDRQPGDRMPCPMCRKEFTVPDGGLSGTQKNFFMEKLMDVRKLSAEEEEESGIPCDVCSSVEATPLTEATSTAMQPATVVDGQKCSRGDAGIKATADYVQVKIEKEATVPVATCDVHRGKEIEVFCQECREAICVKCFMTSHKDHDCSDIEQVSGDLRKQVNNDIDKVSELLKKTGEVLRRFRKEKNDLVNRFDGIEDEIKTVADKLIAAIQRDKDKLLSEVVSVRQKQVKQLQTVKRDVEKHVTELESFNRDSETLLSSGTDCDVARSSSSLHDRAIDLMTFDVVGHLDNSLSPLTVKFTPSSLLADAENLIGSIGMYKLFTSYSYI